MVGAGLAPALESSPWTIRHELLPPPLILTDLPFEPIPFWLQAMHPYLFEHFDRADIIIEALGGNNIDPLFLKCPCNETMRHFSRIALIAILRNDAIPDLDNPLLVWSAHKPYIANHGLVRFVDNDPVPNRIGWRFFHLLHKERQGFCQVWPRPVLRYTHSEHFNQPGFIIDGSLFEGQRERN